MGVAMMTCDFLMPSEMPDLADIDWDAIVEPMEPLEVVVDTVFSYTRDKGNLPANFPSGLDADASTVPATSFSATTVLHHRPAISSFIPTAI